MSLLGKFKHYLLVGSPRGHDARGISHCVQAATPRDNLSADVFKHTIDSRLTGRNNSASGLVAHNPCGGNTTVPSHAVDLFLQLKVKALSQVAREFLTTDVRNSARDRIEALG